MAAWNDEMKMSFISKIFILTSSICFLYLDSLRCLEIYVLPSKLGKNVKQRKFMKQI